MKHKPYPPYRVFWNWELTHDCNYKCSYCPTWRDDVKTPRYLTVAEWGSIWDRIFDLYYSCVVRFTGGEPSVYPGFSGIVGVIARKHTIDITTNLSFDIKDFVNSVEPGNVAISASFHPEFDDIHEFLDKITFLNKEGFVSTICFVGYPPHLNKLRYFKSAAEDKNIMFKFLPFTGDYSEKKYPQDYTDEEKQIMKEAAGDSHDDKANDINSTWYEWNAERRDNEEGKKQGKICRMGQMYAIIGTSGDVKRCCAHDLKAFGNIFDEDFRLLDEPAPCSAVKCPCFKSMVVGQEFNWASLWEGLPHGKYR